VTGYDSRRADCTVCVIEEESMTAWKHQEPGKPTRVSRVLSALAAAESVLLVIGGVAFASGLDRSSPIWVGFVIALVLFAQAVLMYQLSTRLTTAEISVSWWRHLWARRLDGADDAQLESWHRLAEEPYGPPGGV
jgi:hypothetical protein